MTRLEKYLISAAVLLAAASSQAATSTPPWKFVSSPDWFNRDVADLSEAPGWDSHGGLNGVTPQMVAVYNSVIAEMAGYNPAFFAVAGDLINGRWFTDAFLDMFDPVSPNRVEAIGKAGEIYYGWYQWLFSDIAPLLGAVGDHEIGDDGWPPGSEKSQHVPDMKAAFGSNMVAGFPTTVLGVDARPYGTPFANSSYAYRHANLLLVSVDVFRQQSPTTQIHAIHGSVSPDVSGAHLAWLSALLDAADSDNSIDHVVVQGHTPVLRPVRMQNTSGMMLVGREDSAFWQLLRQHDQRRGGKVRLYLCGEVHAVTASRDPDGDIVQLVHGNPPVTQGTTPYAGLGNYVVFAVEPGRISAELRRFALAADGSSYYWQPSDAQTLAVTSSGSSISAGALVIDTGGEQASITASGDLALVDQHGLTLHFGFDDTTVSGNFSNGGSIGNDFYEGVARGGAVAVAGFFGKALQLDGSDDHVESGRGNITEGESRTVSAWVSSSYHGVQTIFSYGRDKYASSINGRFNFQLDQGGRPIVNIGPGRSCSAAGAPDVASGQWRHVAVVLTDAHANSCADLRYYVDGVGYTASAQNAAARLNTVSWSNMRIGAGVVDKWVDYHFQGNIDDVAMWGAPLSDARARALYHAGADARLRYDAAAMERLFDLFDAQQGEAAIGERTWVYTQGLKGSGGEVLDLGGRLAIQLDALGNGVAEQQQAASFMPILYLYLQGKK